MPQFLPLMNQQGNAPSQDLLRQPQMTDDEIRTERKRLIDERYTRTGNKKERDSYYERYGIVSLEGGEFAKPAVEKFTPESRAIYEKTGRASDLEAKPPKPTKKPIKPTAQKRYEADLSYKQAINAVIMAGFDVDWKDETIEFGDMNLETHERLKQALSMYGYEPVSRGKKSWRGKVSTETMEILGIQPSATPETVEAGPITPQAETAELPEGVTMEDVEFTAKEEGLTVEEVLKRIR